MTSSTSSSTNLGKISITLLQRNFARSPSNQTKLVLVFQHIGVTYMNPFFHVLICQEPFNNFIFLFNIAFHFNQGQTLAFSVTMIFTLIAFLYCVFLFSKLRSLKKNNQKEGKGQQNYQLLSKTTNYSFKFLSYLTSTTKLMDLPTYLQRIFFGKSLYN